jgi:hypothetical protein
MRYHLKDAEEAARTILALTGEDVPARAAAILRGWPTEANARRTTVVGPEVCTDLTTQERYLMEHATGWRTRIPLYRNHFVTSEGTTDWVTIQALCTRSLMRLRCGPSELSGGGSVFIVTDSGIAALRAAKERDD